MQGEVGVRRHAAMARRTAEARGVGGDHDSTHMQRACGVQRRIRNCLCRAAARMGAGLVDQRAELDASRREGMAVMDIEQSRGRRIPVALVAG